MNKNFLLLGAVFGFLAVALGAFGAHALEPFLERTSRLNTFETAVKYQFFHTLLLLIYGIIPSKNALKLVKWGGYAAVAGILLFSGSLYLLIFTGIKWLGAITPIGGLLFLISWILLGFYAKTITKDQ